MNRFLSREPGLQAAYAALRSLVVATVVLGIAYPLACARLAAWAWPVQAAGSLVTVPGQPVPVSSALLATPPQGQGMFVPRPSLAGQGYDPFSTGASQLSPRNADWLATVRQRARDWQQRTGSTAPVPVDLVTASGSGLDPDLSLAAALYQVPAVARERGLPEAALRALVIGQQQPALFGVVGERQVNVLRLNLALEKLDGAVPPGTR